ncbi:hypothetical protein Y032_0102g3458 [Ancylostoma ceylanicum]|uniref:Uncharacterized protein n=1 Tax=Ancylostoma ceylanicum TaxID=53326 RepID=A0A016THC1_9BILA|nr:hypothetical protein Y032_0102g3458 [Ancylostoma ceylanicum]
MDTPLAPAPAALPVQIRRGKKHKIDFGGSPPASDDLDHAVDLVLNDASLPAHLRTVVSHLLQFKDQFAVLLQKNRELIDENDRFRKENSDLLNENTSLKSQIGNLRSELSRIRNSPLEQLDEPKSASFCVCEETERKRSIVIAGIAECEANLSSTKVIYDNNCVRRILDHLSIQCHPVAVYRMGRINSNRPRLLKVVLPSSYYSSLTLRRAPKLKSFSVRGIFIRPSLPKCERDRLRGLRLSRSSPHAEGVSCSAIIPSQPLLDSQQSQISQSMSPHLTNSCIDGGDPMISQSSENV